MNYSNLSQHQLIRIAHDVGLHDEKLNKEWHSRFGLNFPYTLNVKNQIENKLLDITIGDEECDSLILEQAKQLRERRKNR